MKNNYVVLVMAALLTAVPVSARFNASKTDAPAAHVGIRAGITASEYVNLDRPEVLAMALGGLHIDFKVAKVPLYIETGAYYMDMGTKFRDRDGYWHYRFDTGSNSGSGYANGERYDEIGRAYHYSSGHDRWDDGDCYTVHNYSVLVPLAVSYHLYASDHFVIQPFTGFYGSYGFTSEEMDFGVREGIGLSFGHLNISLGVNVGLLDQKQKKDNVWVEEARHVSLFFGIGVNF